MKKRLAKVLALGLTAAMVAGAPLSAMASEVNAADQAGETAVVAESAGRNTCGTGQFCSEYKRFVGMQLRQGEF